MTKEILKQMLDRHKHYLNRDCDGWESMRCILIDEDLDGADLRGADLRDASLKDVNLYHASLRDANLADAEIYNCNLGEADMSYADCSRAHLWHNCMQMVTLIGANLYNADLKDCDLGSANLACANLSHADVGGTDFSDACVNGTIFYDTILLHAMHRPYIPMACPEEGSFVAWKKAHGTVRLKDKKHIREDVLIKLKVLASAERSSGTSRKCRCSRARVLGIYELDGTPCEYTCAVSMYDKYFIYEKGKIVSVSNFDTCRWNECTAGIHFFLSQQEAARYSM